MMARDPGRLWGSWGFNPWVVGMLLGTGTRKAKAVIRGFQPRGDKQQQQKSCSLALCSPSCHLDCGDRLGVGVRADRGDGLLGQ